MNPLSSASPDTEPSIVRARALLAEDREAEAAALLERHPSPAADHLHLEIATRAATAALRARELSSAIAWLDRGLARAPHDGVLNFFRGNLHLDAGHHAAAVACFRHSVAADPQREEFVCNLGHALVVAGRPAEALPVLDELPDSANAQMNRGTAYEQLGDWVRAAEAYDRAGRLRPDQYEAWFNLGGARARLGDGHGALAAFNRAVALRPTEGQVHLERGHALIQLRNLPDAAVSFERATRSDSTRLAARLALVHTRQFLCDWRDLPSLRADLVDPVLAALEGGRRFNPFTLLALPGGLTPGEMRRVAAARAARLAQGARPLRASAAIPPDRPLRIGYVSPDFGNHPVGHSLRSLLAGHDRRRVSVHGFSLAPHPAGDCRDALRAGCDTWDELHALADAAAAAQIASREIDVLVDLAGHTLNNRLELFAWRPAPVQVAWLGYPGTTGAPFIDVLLADSVVIPDGGESAFSERIVRLPGCYLPGDDSQSIAPGGDTRAEHGLPAEGVVFCAFNNAFKIEPVIFGTWMEILRRVDHAVLWLRGGSAVMEANLGREAAIRGIDPIRLVFDRQGLPKDRHLARHRAADLYLDTHFYNAHTTAADALRAGLPVLTCPGAAFPARVGASLVSALGLAEELIAPSLDDYVERAVRLAREPDRRRALGERLAAARGANDCFNTAAFARKLEQAYHELASDHAAGPP